MKLYVAIDLQMERAYRVHLANTAPIQQYEGLKYTDDHSDADAGEGSGLESMQREKSAARPFNLNNAWEQSCGSNLAR